MQVIINIIIDLFIYLLVAWSFAIIYQTNKFFHIAHAISITFGAYFTFLFSIQVGFSLLFAIPLSILLGSLIMYSTHIMIFEKLLEKKVSGWPILVASLGVYIILQNVISIIWGDSVESFRTWPINEGYQIYGAYITFEQLLMIIISFMLVAVSWFFIKKTNLGKKIEAIADNKELSVIFGIRPKSIIIFSYTIGSSLAVCAGILISVDVDMTPNMGFSWLLYGVIAMVIGGLGKMRYLILGSLILATSQHLSAYLIDSKWMQATAFILLILFLAWKPYGFSGQKLRKAEI